MSKLEFIQRHSLIINYLRRRKASFQDISDYLERESEMHDYNFMMSQRTFQRDIKEILSIYNVEIKCNKSSGLYEIVEDAEDLADNSSLQLLEAIDLFSALNLTDNYKQLFQFSSRINKGTEHIFGLLHAIKNRQYLNFTYKKFYSDIAESRRVEPLLIKEFKGRYYLIAFDTARDALRTFGLERIIDISVDKKRFKARADFNAQNLFKNAYGIIAPANAKVEKIVLKFDKDQAAYINSFPFHSSQKIVKEDKNSKSFELNIYVTEDFIFELMSHTGHFSIIEPIRLRNQVRKIYKDSIAKI